MKHLGLARDKGQIKDHGHLQEEMQKWHISIGARLGVGGCEEMSFYIIFPGWGGGRPFLINLL